MNRSDIVDQLKGLVRIDLDAVHAYGQALDAINIPEVRRRLTDCRDDHERHVAELSLVLRRMGEEPPVAAAPNANGFLIQGYTAVRAAMGTAGALRAMKANEVLSNAIYGRAWELDWPADIAPIIARHRRDERHHFAYIDAALRTRVWERESLAGGPAAQPYGGHEQPPGGIASMVLGGALLAYGLARPSRVSTLAAMLGAAVLLYKIGERRGVTRPLLGDDQIRSRSPATHGFGRRGTEGAVAVARRGWDEGHPDSNPPGPGNGRVLH